MGDILEHIPCKEWNIVAEAAARNASWLVVLGEDNYVDTRRVEKFLAKRSPEDPIAFGCVGCGKGLFCRDTEAFKEDGGFCGGCGYFLSRAALRLLAGESVFYRSSRWPNDMTTSCLLHKHGVRLQGIGNHNQKGLYGSNNSKQILRLLLKRGFMTLHYLKPAEMRWVHAVVSNSSEGGGDVDGDTRLESLAFDPAI